MKKEKEPIKKPGSTAERVRQHRQRRRAAELTEVKVWVRKKDVLIIHQLLNPFTQIADLLIRDSKNPALQNRKVKLYGFDQIDIEDYLREKAGKK